MGEESRGEINMSLNVLDPDHHLLEKFQQALKQHLLTQINRLKEEVFEIETESQKKKAEIEEVGVLAYEFQQKVCAQHRELENLVQNVETVTAAREQKLNELENNKKELKNIENTLFQTEKSNRDLLREIEAISMLNKQLSATENNIENTISINKRKAEKTRLDNKKLAKEKKQQDYMIYALSEEVWKQESELETLNMQIRIKEKEIEDLEEKVAIGNTGISALQTEYRSLMHSWDSVVIAIGTRDKGLECLQQEVNKLDEKYKATLTEIEQVRKLTKKELVENEVYTYRKKTILAEIKACSTDVNSQLDKKAELENKIFELHSILERTDQDIKIIQDEIVHKQHALDRVIKDYDSVYLKKSTLEEDILKYIQGELTNNKLAKRTRIASEEIREKRRRMELLRNETTNRRSFLKAQITFQSYKNDEMMQIKNDLQEQFEILEKEQKILRTEQEKYEVRYRKKEKLYQAVNIKLDLIIKKQTGETLTKGEIKMKDTEKMISEIQQSVRKLQVVWLREQNNIISISNERQDQIQDMNRLKKQVLVLQQKNIRISDEIDDIKKREEKVKHNLNMLINKAAVLGETLFKKRNVKMNLDRNTTLLQSTYDTKLKDSELELLHIEAEIAEIDEDKLQLSKELISINREALEWEKQFLLAKDTFMNMKEARGKGGELNSMQLEIHKMEIIYGQLKKAQEKLVKDMEYCISRRDKIFYSSEAIQSMHGDKKGDPAEKIRMNLTKKLDNIKNQIKRVENDIETTKKKITVEEKAKTDHLKKISYIKTRERSIHGHLDVLKKELEETKISRELKFELLVLNQRKAVLYKQIIKKQTPYVVYKKKDDLVNEYNKAKSINERLIKITGNLRRDFPDKLYVLCRIENMLGVVSLCMYG
ncbi:unnamed protein product [Diabrotica balteata]|uniref:Coiled-coil domain-containing protein 40 n=1 Tax=Diabrotica balteata TaxID=107213 RepID=A0A9P0GTH5_DIABA|nr:unnamed protein product [Diabrotica balteata]